MNTNFAQELLRARASGPEAMQTLAEQHLPLVGLMVRRFPDCGVSKDDLYQQGVIGLMKALNHFDPAHGTTFATYAASMILGEMRMLQRMHAPLHIPRTELELRRKIRRTEDTLSSRLGHSPTVHELASALHMDAAELVLHLEDISVASSDTRNDSGTALADMLPDPEDWQQRIELRDILSHLPEKDQQLMLLRHHLGLTQTQAGKRLGMTQMQVSRREAIIRTLLRRALAD